jgi:hypothetical protein
MVDEEPLDEEPLDDTNSHLHLERRVNAHVAELPRKHSFTRKHEVCPMQKIGGCLNVSCFLKDAWEALRVS